MGKDIVRNLKKEQENLKKDILGSIKYTDKDKSDYIKVINKALNKLGNSLIKENVKKNEILNKYGNIVIGLDSRYKVENSLDRKVLNILSFSGKIEDAVTDYNKNSEYYIGGVFTDYYSEDNVIVVIGNIDKGNKNLSTVVYITNKKSMKKYFVSGGFYTERSTPEFRKRNGHNNKINRMKGVYIDDILAISNLKDRLKGKGFDDIIWYALLEKNLFKPDKPFKYNGIKEGLEWYLKDTGKRTLKDLSKELIDISETYNLKKRQLVYDITKIKDESKQKVKTFEDKENKVKKVFNLSKKNKYVDSKIFSKVELDDEVNVELFKKSEKDFEDNFYKLGIPTLKTKPILRFRKLGHIRALGVYYPTYNTIALDFRKMGAFVHEYGHYIDYNYDNSVNMLSTNKEFKPIIDRYTYLYNKNGSPYKNLKTKYNDDYFLVPTEIFARGYEIYNLKKGIDTNLLLKKSDYNTYEYLIFKDSELQEMIDNYYKKL